MTKSLLWHDMAVSHIDNIEELPKHTLNELRNFFEDYKKLENKEVVVEKFQNKQLAQKIFQQSIEDYKLKFPDKV